MEILNPIISTHKVSVVAYTHHPVIVMPVIVCKEPKSSTVHASCMIGITQNVVGLSVMMRDMIDFQ